MAPTSTSTPLSSATAFGHPSGHGPGPKFLLSRSSSPPCHHRRTRMPYGMEPHLAQNSTKKRKNHIRIQYNSFFYFYANSNSNSLAAGCSATKYQNHPISAATPPTTDEKRIRKPNHSMKTKRTCTSRTRWTSTCPQPSGHRTLLALPS